MKKNSKPKRMFFAACVNCGKFIEEEPVIINARNYCKLCGELQRDQMISNEIKAPEGMLKIFSYIFSFINPFIGFLLGVVFYPQKQNVRARIFGKNCLILMGISLSFILLFLILLFIIGEGIFGGDIFYNIKEGYY